MKPWRISACSVQGSSHKISGGPCQDAFEWQAHEGVLVAAVADGAGSASHSEHGAQLAAKAAVDSIVTMLKEPVSGSLPSLEALKTAMAEARQALLTEAENLNLSIRELACTLILIATDQNGAVGAQIGDGAALVLAPGQAMHTLTKPAEAEYLNETVFLSAEDALEQVQVDTWSGEVEGIALFTDGLQMLALKMPEASPYLPFFQPLFQFLKSEPNDRIRQDQFERLLNSPRIRDRTDDDLTLLIAVRS